MKESKDTSRVRTGEITIADHIDDLSLIFQGIIQFPEGMQPLYNMLLHHKVVSGIQCEGIEKMQLLAKRLHLMASEVDNTIEFYKEMQKIQENNGDFMDVFAKGFEKYKQIFASSPNWDKLFESALKNGENRNG